MAGQMHFGPDGANLGQNSRIAWERRHQAPAGGQFPDGQGQNLGASVQNLGSRVEQQMAALLYG
jgi:hypothetical protein